MTKLIIAVAFALAACGTDDPTTGEQRQPACADIGCADGQHLTATCAGVHGPCSNFICHAPELAEPTACEPDPAP